MLSKRDGDSKKYVIVKAAEDDERREAMERAARRRSEVQREQRLDREAAGEPELESLLDEAEPPEPEEDKREVEEQRRASAVFDHLYQELQMFMNEYPEMDLEEALTEVMLTPTNVLLDTLGLSDIDQHDTDIEDEIMDDPVVTPAMAGFFNDVMKDIGVPEDMKRFATANTDSESFNFHTGLTDEFKVPRPDKAIDALRYKTYRSDDGENVEQEEHPLYRRFGGLIRYAIDKNLYDLEGAKAEMARRKRLRNLGQTVGEQEKARVEEAGRRFEDVPKFMEGGEDIDTDSLTDEERARDLVGDKDARGIYQEKVKDAYERLFSEYTPTRGRMEKPKRDYGVLMDKYMEAIEKFKEQNNDRKQTEYEQRLITYNNNKRDLMLQGREDQVALLREPTPPVKSSTLAENRQAFEAIKKLVQDHARTAFSPSIGARQQLEFGRRIESGSDPIMTPLLQAIAARLGVSEDVRFIEPNAPDIMVEQPLKRIIGEESMSPNDPQYRRAVADAITSQIEDKNFISNLHPAIGRNAEIGQHVLDTTGDVFFAQQFQQYGGGVDARRDADLEEQAQIGSQGQIEEGKGIGSQITGVYGALVDANGNTIYKPAHELAQMSDAEKKKYYERLQRAGNERRRKLRAIGILDAGKRSDEHIKAREKLDDKKAQDLGFNEKMNEVEDARRQLKAGLITRTQFEEMYGRAIREGGDQFAEYLDRREGLEIPQFPEGHFLHNEDPNKTKQSINNLFTRLLGVKSLMHAAQKKLEMAKEDESIANPDDLAILFKPPSERSADDRKKLDSFTAAGITRHWWETRLGQNQALKDSMRESGIRPSEFLEMARRALGGKDMSKDSMEGVIEAFSRQISDAPSVAYMINKYLTIKQRDATENALHHNKTKEQTEQVLDDALPSDEQECVACVGSPQRTKNIGENRGGKGGRLSPYIYKNREIPDLRGLPFGSMSDITDGDVENKLGVFHEIMGFRDTEDGWNRAYNMLLNSRDPNFLIEARLKKISPSQASMIQERLGVPMRIVQDQPHGLARDLTEDPFIQEFLKHAFPRGGQSGQLADERLRTLERNQKNDMLAAVAMHNTIRALPVKQRKQLHTPTSNSQGEKKKLIRSLIKLSGAQDASKAKVAYSKYMKTHTVEKKNKATGKVEIKTIDGWEDQLEDLTRLRMPRYDEVIKDIQEMSAKLTDENEATLKPRIKELNDERVALRKRGEGAIKSLGQGYKSFNGAYNFYLKGLEKAKELKDTMNEAIEAQLFPINNRVIATYTNMRPQINRLARDMQGATDEDAMSALNRLHQEHFTENGLNTRKRYNFKVKYKQKARADGTRGIEFGYTGEDYDLFDDIDRAGLTGRMEETFGSAIDDAMSAYHIPMPENTDEAVRILGERGILVTDDMVRSLKEQEGKTVLDTSMFDDALEEQKREHGKQNDYFTEREIRKKNQSYMEANRRNYDNKTGCATRCGTCGGSGSLSMDEYIHYIQAHDESLQGLTRNDTQIKNYILHNARPQDFASFHAYNEEHDVERSHDDHGHYACPDCEHFDASCGPNGGMVSDGICSHCLGDGVVRNNDEHLKSQITQHKHKVPNNLDIEFLNDKMQSRAQALAERRGEGEDDVFSETLEEMLRGVSPVHPMKYYLSALEDGQFPMLHSQEEVDRAKNKQLEERIAAYMTNQMKAHHKQTDADAEKERNRALHSTLEGHGLIFDIRGPRQPMKKTTTQLLLDNHGRESLIKQMKHIIKTAKARGADTATINKLKRKAIHVRDKLIQGDGYGAQKEAGSEAMQHFLSMQHIAEEFYEHIDEGQRLSFMSEEEKKKFDDMDDKEKKKFLNSIYTRRNKIKSPQLHHRGGRTVTDKEMDLMNDWDNGHEAKIVKTPKMVRDFFVTHDSRKNPTKLQQAFETIGSKWTKQKEQIENNAEKFLKDAKDIVARGEEPLMKASNVRLYDDDDYLEMAKKHGLYTPQEGEDFFTKLSDGNILHRFLDKEHFENAKDFLKGWNKQEERFTDALHSRLEDNVTAKVRSEWLNLAKMRATEVFFKNNVMDSFDNPRGGKFTMPDGDPMTLEYYLENKGTMDKKQRLNIEDAINEHLTDKDGNPLDLSEGEKSVYYIRNRFPASEDDTDFGLDKHALNEYVDKRMTDLTYDLTDVENSYEKLQNFINTTMERADQLNLKRNGGLSHDDATRIVERANDIYDAYHYPNLFYEQKIHDLMEDMDVEDIDELNQMFKDPAYRNERAEMTDYLDLIQTLHPHWSGSPIAQNKLESQLRALLPTATRSPQQTTLQGEDLDPQQQREAYRQASARALGLQEQVPVYGPKTYETDRDERFAPGPPQPQPGQVSLDYKPTFVTDIFGRRTTPGEQPTFAVPPNQQNQQ